MNLIIRKMEPSDIPYVAEVVKTNWPDSRRVNDGISKELEDMFSTANFRPTFFVAQTDNKIIGCGGWNWCWHNYDNYTLLWGNVIHPYRGLGIGRKLVEARLEDIQTIAKQENERQLSYVLVSTHHREMYEKFGFLSIHIMDLWQSPLTHLMVREI